MGAQYLQHAADGGLIRAQLLYANMLRKGDEIQANAQMSAHYSKLAADQGSVESQLRYASCLLHGDGVKINMTEAERYFQLACDQGDSTAQMQYGIALLSGLLGRFDFDKARIRFDAASSLNRFALILRDALSTFDDHLVTPDNFYEFRSVFSFMRCQSDGGLPFIQLMNPYLCHKIQEPTQVLGVWKEMIQSSIEYLHDLSQIRSNALCSLPTDLTSCSSIREMIPLIFKMYSIESPLYRNVNHFLRCFPIQVLGKFMKELRGVLSYIYLLQSSIDYCSRIQPFTESLVVYRGLRSKGSELVPLYESMIGQVIVWPGFTSTSTNVEYVIRHFVRGPDGILFKINLHPGDVAARIQDYSKHQHESEVLVAALSGFVVVATQPFQVPKGNPDDSTAFTIPMVILNYSVSWIDFDIDSIPQPFMV
jgi:hypothetical protein